MSDIPSIDNGPMVHRERENEMNAENLIAAALAAPKTHRVVTTYACGKTRTFDTRSLASAENYAVGDRRKIGRDLIDCDSGEKVRVVSVEIAPIQ